MSRRTFVVVVLALGLTLIAGSGAALEPDKDGWYHTGQGVRVKTIAFINVKAYAIGHWVKKLPPVKSKQAVIDLDADKQLSFVMMRDVPEGKIKTMFRDAFALNGYRDAKKIDAFLGVFTAELEKGTHTTIRYDATKKATTIAVSGRSATIDSEEFMRATWSVWFGKSEQPELGDALISKL